MTSVLVNAIVAFWIILFGAMTIVPFLLEGKSAARSNESATASAKADDRVISIRPVGVGVARPQDQHVDAPGQVPASILAAASARAASRDDRAGNHHQRQAA